MITAPLQKQKNFSAWYHHVIKQSLRVRLLLLCARLSMLQRYHRAKLFAITPTLPHSPLPHQRGAMGIIHTNGNGDPQAERLQTSLARVLQEQPTTMVNLPRQKIFSAW